MGKMEIGNMSDAQKVLPVLKEYTSREILIQLPFCSTGFGPLGGASFRLRDLFLGRTGVFRRSVVPVENGDSFFHFSVALFRGWLHWSMGKGLLPHPDFGFFPPLSSSNCLSRNLGHFIISLFVHLFPVHRPDDAAV